MYVAPFWILEPSSEVFRLHSFKLNFNPDTDVSWLSIHRHIFLNRLSAVGRVYCLEEGCRDVVISLVPRPNVKDGGLKEGFGSLLAYRVSKFHTMVSFSSMPPRIIESILRFFPFMSAIVLMSAYRRISKTLQLTEPVVSNAYSQPLGEEHPQQPRVSLPPAPQSSPRQRVPQSTGLPRRVA